MGLSFSWIAVQGLTREQVLDALDMGVSDVRTDLLEGIALFDWTDDWLIVLSGDYRDAMDGPLSDLEQLAEFACACAVDVDEHGNRLFCAASGHGEDDWFIKVVPSKRVFSVVGSVPDQLDPLIRDAKDQEPHDGGKAFFEIPVRLAESICGFRLGESDLDAVGHVSLKSNGASRPASSERPEPATGKPGFFARLFGRR